MLFCLSNGISQTIYTKDGKSFGLREEFISGCVESAEVELMNFNGIEMNTENYCSCVCDNLIPTLYSYEIKEAISNNALLDLFTKEENLEILMDCISEVKIADDFIYNADNQSEIGDKIAVANCIREIIEDPISEGRFSYEMAEEYCLCAIDKLFSIGYTYKELQEFENKNSKVFNEITIQCINEIHQDEIEQVSQNIYNIEDIEGDYYSSKVPLLDYLNLGYKIKISINGIIRYYMFDTGATDLIINWEIERELLINGSLNKESYIGEKEYILANNEIIKAHLVKLNNVKIGDYTVNNVTAAILDEGALLCGKSFLDKFRKWVLDKENKILILYK